jgi:hypothetical protein
MKRTQIPAVLLVPAMFLVTVSFANGAPHKWKFSPTINAPWALEDDQQPLDTPAAAAGLCRSGPFNTLAAYGPLGSNIDAIVGDQPNNSGFSNFGCTTAQNETTIAVNPTNNANLIVGANDYRIGKAAARDTWTSSSSTCRKSRPLVGLHADPRPEPGDGMLAQPDRDYGLCGAGWDVPPRDL